MELNNCQEWCGKIEPVGSVSGLLHDLRELDVSTEFDCIETRECGGDGARGERFLCRVGFEVPRACGEDFHPEFKGRNSQTRV